jgi:hypothetical protein
VANDAVTLEENITKQWIQRCRLTVVSSCHLPETRELLDACLMQNMVASYLAQSFHICQWQISCHENILVKDNGKHAATLKNILKEFKCNCCKVLVLMKWVQRRKKDKFSFFFSIFSVL